MAGRYNDTWDYFQTKILLYQTQKCQEETNKDIFEARRLHFESEEAKGMYYFNTFMQKNWELDKPASLDEAVFPKKKIDYFCDE